MNSVNIRRLRLALALAIGGVLFAPGAAHAGKVVEFVPVASHNGDEPVLLTPVREGGTFELGFGLQYTTEHIADDNRMAGLLALSFGWFLNDSTALLIRGVLSSNGSTQDFTVNQGGYGYNATAVQTKTTYYIGPAIQVFPLERVMLSAGLGFVDQRDLIDFNVHRTSVGDYDDSKNHLGMGASLRAGFAIYQRHEGGALRLTAEALPTLVHGNFGIAAGLSLEVQVF